MLNNIKTIKTERGFTIVELLIVIVVIAILAAITIVAYNGIQSRAKASSAEALASSIAKKAEVYNIDPSTTGYPVTFATLTGAAQSATYYVDSSSAVLATAVMTAAPASNAEKTIVFRRCGHNGTTTAPTTLAGITTNTGISVGYWDSSAQYINTGQTSGSVGTFPVACFPTAT